MSAKFGVPVIPRQGHGGNCTSTWCRSTTSRSGCRHFLEHIPHLRKHFKYPVRIEDGRYHLPSEPGCSMDFVD